MEEDVLERAKKKMVLEYASMSSFAALSDVPLLTSVTCTSHQPNGH
jgi:hypothetical protein